MTQPGRATLRTLLPELDQVTRCIGPDVVERIAVICGGGITAEDVRVELRDHYNGEPWVAEDGLPVLPDAPPPTLPPTLIEHVRDSQLRLSVQAVFDGDLTYRFDIIGGFALPSKRALDTDTVREAQERVTREPQTPLRDARLAVLADLEAASHTPDALDEILLWEIVSVLRRYASDEVTQRRLSNQIGNLEVSARDADLLAAAALGDAALPAALRNVRPPADPSRTPPSQPPPSRPAPTKAPRTDAPSRPEALAEPIPPPSPPRSAPAPTPPDLQLTPGRRAGTLVVTWQPDPAATIDLRRAPERPRWPVGSRVTSADMLGHGTSEPLREAISTADGRLRLDLEASDHQVYLSAFARTGEGVVVVGKTVVLSDSEPVRDLTVRRFQGECRLSFVWPGGADAIMADFVPDGATSGEEHRCRRHDFLNGGGFALPVGYGAGQVRVRAVHGWGDREVLSAPVVVPVAPGAVPVRYRIDVPGRLSLKVGRLEVTAEADCGVPNLVAVAGFVPRQRPTRLADGEQLGVLLAQDLTAGVTVGVGLARPSRTPEWLVCLVERPTGNEHVALIPDPSTDHRRRR